MSQENLTDNIENKTTEDHLRDFMNRFGVIRREMETLKDAQKDLIDEFDGTLDIKTLKKAMRVVKIESELDHLDTFDQYKKILEKEEIYV